MKHFRIILILLGPLTYIAGFILTRSLDESEGGLGMLFFYALGTIFLIAGIALFIAKLVSDKLSNKQ